MKRLVFTAILCMSAVPAYAQHIEFRSLCHQLTPNVPEGVEGAEYQGGRDVDGKPVAPADLNQEIKAIEYPLEIPVEIDTLKLLGVVNEEVVDLDTIPAVLLVHEDGRVEYNGQDISDRASYVCDDSKPAEIVEPVPAQTPAVPAPAPQTAPASAPAAAPVTEEPKAQTPE